MLDTGAWSTGAGLRAGIVSWIEGTYHRRRKQEGLGRKTPVVFEEALQASTDSLAA